MRIGKVIRVENEFAHIELSDSEACDTCHAKALCRPNDDGKRVLRLENKLNAKVNDKVGLENSESNQVKITAMQYGLPLTGFLLTIILSNKYIPSFPFGIPAELGQFILGLIVIGITGGITFLWSKRKLAKKFSVYEMKRIMEGCDQSTIDQ